MKQNNTDSKTKVVILHGFENDEIFAAMRAVKKELKENSEVAFALTTATSLETKLVDVIKDVQQEHAYFKKNPPKNSAT